MHDVVKSWQVGQFKATWWFDTGMGFGGTNILDVENPTIEGDKLNRTFYFTEDTNPEPHMRAYVQKLASDPQYLKSVLAGDADWQKTGEVFEDLEQHNKDYSDKMNEVFNGTYDVIGKNISTLYLRWQTEPLVVLNEFIDRYHLKGISIHQCAGLGGRWVCDCSPANPLEWEQHQKYHAHWLKGEVAPSTMESSHQNSKT
jgi:hypothetical protein